MIGHNRERHGWVLAICLALTLAEGLAACGPGGGQPAASSIGGPFHLIDQTGRARDQSLLRGKWSAVFFGYTYCPDVCPTTLQTLGSTVGLLGSRAKDFQVVFVTVDPTRDTPGQLKDYLASASFPPGAIGLTGTPSQVAAAAAAYKVYYQKTGSGANYGVDHSAAIYLMDPQGRFDTVIPFGLTPDQTRDQIVKAMRSES